MNFATDHFTAAEIDIKDQTDRTLGYHGKRRFPENHINMHYGQQDHVVSGNLNQELTKSPSFVTTQKLFHNNESTLSAKKNKQVNPKSLFHNMAHKSRYNDHKKTSTYGPGGTLTTFDADKTGVSDSIIKQVHGDDIDLHTNLDNILSPYH